MATKIMSGFPLRRCSWYCTPIVPVAMTRRMIRWLDAVCLKQVTFKVWASPLLRLSNNGQTHN